jgi:hypothetical protein
MVSESRWLASFPSIHYALAAERALNERGLWCDLIPAPREISSDCGMVLEFRAENRDEVRAVLSNPALSLRAVFAPGPHGLGRVEW